MCARKGVVLTIVEVAKSAASAEPVTRLYCKQHDPKAVKEREEASLSRLRARIRARKLPLERMFEEILRLRSLVKRAASHCDDATRAAILEELG